MRALAGNPTTPVAWPDACCPVSVGKGVEKLFEKTNPILKGAK